MKYITFVEKNEDRHIVINAENINREEIELDDGAIIITYAEFDDEYSRDVFSELQSMRYGFIIYDLIEVNGKQTIEKTTKRNFRDETDEAIKNENPLLRELRNIGFRFVLEAIILSKNMRDNKLTDLDQDAVEALAKELFEKIEEDRNRGAGYDTMCEISNSVIEKHLEGDTN